MDTNLIAFEIKSETETNESYLRKLGNEIITIPKNSQDRNARMILGHLIDSASNNIHRVVHLQYRESPVDFPNYATFGNNDRWIAIQNYKEEDWQEMISLWKSLNLHLAHVIRSIDESCLEKEWIAGPGRLITLEKMINDYMPHFRLHIGEIIDLTTV